VEVQVENEEAGVTTARVRVNADYDNEKKTAHFSLRGGVSVKCARRCVGAMD